MRITIAIMITVWTVLLLMTSKSALAFDANLFASAGIGKQMYSKGQTVCATLETVEQVTDSEGNTVNLTRKYTSGYVGYADAGFWVSPGAAIFIIGGYSYIGCTGDGLELHGPMIALQAGSKAYGRIKAVYVGKDEDQPEEEQTEIAYVPSVGARFDGLSVDAFAFVYDKNITGVLGLTLNF